MDHILLWTMCRRQAYFRTLYNRKKNALSRTYFIHVQDADKSVVYSFSYVPFRNGLRLPSSTPSILRVARSPAAPPPQSAAGPVTTLRALCDQDRIRRIVFPPEGQRNGGCHKTYERGAKLTEIIGMCCSTHGLDPRGECRA
jgi:hypothetical protein